MNKKQGVIGLIALTVVFVLGLYFIAFADYNKPEQPKYDFIYTTYDYSQSPQFDTNGNPIPTEKSEQAIINSEEKDNYGIQTFDQSAKLGKTYLYDTQTKTSKELSKSEYQQTTKLIENTAPDGYIFQDYNYNNENRLPFNNNNVVNVLTKDDYSVNTEIDANNGVVFVAWVEN